MNRPASKEAIYAAELRVVEAKRATREHFDRSRTALRTTIARPTTLAAVFALATGAGFWLTRKEKRPTKVTYRSRSSSEAATTAAASTSIAGLVLAFAMRYAMERGPALAKALWMARQQRVARGNEAAVNQAAAEYSASPAVR